MARKVKNPFALARFIAKKRGFKKFTKGSPGGRLASKLAEKIKKSERKRKRKRKK